MTRPVLRWTIAGAVAALLVLTVLLVLPLVVRHLAVRRVEAMTGRPVSIRDVDLNLFTRHLVLHDVTIASPGDAPPLATASRVDARFRFIPLFRGRVHLDDLLVVEPAVVVSRPAPRQLSVEDVIAHWRARETGGPVEATLERLRVERGRATFLDRAVQPERRWVVSDLSVDARDISTMQDAATGRASARFVVAGAPTTVEVTDLAVRPFQARASVWVDGLDLARPAVYIPHDAALRVGGGRLTTRVTVQYTADGVVHADVDGTVHELALTRAGQEPGFVTVPLLTMRAHDATYGETVTIADLEVTAPRALVLGTSVARPGSATIRDVRLTFQNEPVPTRPGRLALTATLPGDASVDARGTAQILPPRANLQVDLRGLDVTLAAMWLPDDAALVPRAGELGATVTLDYGDSQRAGRDARLAIAGRAWVDRVAFARGGADAAFLRDDRVEITATDVSLSDAGVALGHVELVASPTVVLRPGGPPLDVAELHVTATGGGTRTREPTHVEAAMALPYRGRVRVQGDARLGTRDATFTLVARGLDARLGTPYLPSDAPLGIPSGRLDARLDGTWSGTLRIDGRMTARQLTVHRRGQDPPLVEHARLEAVLRDLRVGDDGVSLDRAVVSGAPVIVNASVSPPQRFEMRELELVARHITWPGRRAIEFEGHGLADDASRASLRGRLHPATSAADVTLTFYDVALARASAYLPPSVPFVVEGGRLQGTAHLRYTRSTSVHVAANGVATDVGLRVTGAAPVQVVEDRMTFAVDDVVVRDDQTAVRVAVLDASPEVGRVGQPRTPVALHAEVRDLAWPGGWPADVALTVTSGEGRVDVSGTYTPSTRRLEAIVRAQDAAITPLAALLPIQAPVAGTLHADARVVLTPGAASALSARGDLALRTLRIGPEDSAPLRAAEVRADGVVLDEGTLDVARLTVTRPAALVERNEDGSFPLRAMLSAPPAPATRGNAPAATPAESRDDASSRWTFRADDLRITDGSLRFIDRTTSPFYSEEATDLAVTVQDLTNAGDARATLTVQGIIGAEAALDLHGEMAPFATPFFLDVSGELRNFSVPRTNPYMQHFLDWIARRGQLTTQVHYRIVGGELQGTNELRVQRLAVERVGDEERTERLVGVPLGLAVALLKDARGDIHFTLPVTGDVTSPQFSFADAIRSALSRVLGRLVTAPLRAIGSIVRREHGTDVVRVDPLTFEAGSASLAPEAAAHLQRVADVLRASPHVQVRLGGVASEADLQALRTREVVARIQKLQRSQGLPTFDAAALQVWHSSMPPGSLPPRDSDGLVRVLAARARAPLDAARALAEQREDVARTQLVDAAGIPRDRVLEDPGPPTVGARGEGRVEFTLQPSS